MPWAKPSKNIVRFVDAGAGADFVRAARVAKRRLALKKEGKIVALDLDKFLRKSAYPNLLLVQKDATSYLSSLPKGSLGIINFDLSLKRSF